MVVQHGEGVKHDCRRMHAVGELADEPLTVVVRPENLLPPVAAAGDVVQRVGEVNTWRSCHDPNMVPSPISPVKAS